MKKSGPVAIASAAFVGNAAISDSADISFLDSVIESESKILISGYDCELYDRLTDNGFIKYQFEVKTMDGNFNKKTKLETIWRNYTI